MTSSTPIACTLDAGSYAKRVRWAADLNRAALRTWRQRDLTLELEYDKGAEERIRELVRREQQCCAFLRFALEDMPSALILRITAPPETRDAIDAFFAPFLPGTGRPVPGAPMTSCGEASCACGSAAALTSDTESTGAGRAAGVAATSGAVAALACGVCCVLPFALPAAALSTVGGAIAVAAHAYWWALGIGVAAVAGGWLWVCWQSARTGRRPARDDRRDGARDAGARRGVELAAGRAVRDRGAQTRGIRRLSAAGRGCAASSRSRSRRRRSAHSSTHA
jgi:hypothetical protein